MQRAIAALASGDEPTALAELRAHWERDPVIARAIEYLARHVDTADHSWSQRLAMVGELDGAAAAREVNAAAAAPPDPVIARWVVDLLVRASHNQDRGCHLTKHEFWLAVARALAAHGHLGLQPELTAAGGRLSLATGKQQAGLTTFSALRRRDVRTALSTAITQVISLPSRSPSAETLAVADWLDRQTAHRRADNRTGDELLAAIHAAPDDDGPRMVYADWLTERRDPRGEFITMQLDRHRRGIARPTAEERALVTRFARQWLGPLEPIVRKSGLRYARGFVAGCEIYTSSFDRAEQLRGVPEWATIEDLALGNDLKVIGGDYHRAVRRLTGVYASQAAVFGAPHHWPALEHLNVRIDDRVLVERCSGFAKLQSLDLLGSLVGGFEPSSLRWLWDTAIGARLTTLTIGSGASSLAAWLAEDRARRMPIATLCITSIRWSGVGPGWQLTMTRDDRGELCRLVAIHGSYRIYERAPLPLDELCDAIAVVRGGLRSITLEPSRTLDATKAQLARLAALTRDLGISLTSNV